MLKLKCLLIPTFLFYTCASYATTPDGHDTVSFKNGDSLTGNVVSGTAAGVVFANQAVGSLTLKWSDLKNLSIKHMVSVACTACAKPKEFANPEITVDPASTPDHVNLGIKQAKGPLVSLMDVQSLAPAAQPGPIEHPGWIPTLSGSVGFIVSTQRDHSYASGITLYKNWYAGGASSPGQRTFIDLGVKYDDKRKNPSPGSATVTNYDSGKFQQIFFVPRTSSYVVLTSDLVRNNSLGIFFQQAYGAGVGTIIKQLELDADLRFIGEHFYGPNPSQALAAAELSAKYNLNLMVVGNGGKVPGDPAKTKVVTATPSFAFVPVFNASRAWQMQGRIDLTVPLTAKYALVPRLEDYYVENAPSPFRKNYLNVSVMLKVTPTAKQ
jgi:hypothetical protein